MTHGLLENGKIYSNFQFGEKNPEAFLDGQIIVFDCSILLIYWNIKEIRTARHLVCQNFSIFFTRSVNHTMPGPKIFIPGFVTVNRAPVTWFTIVKDRLQSTLG